MKSLKIIIYTILIGFYSCKPTSETTTTHINSGLVSETGIIYALPKTNLKFTIEAVRTDIIPGPYSDYAEKYMGLEDVPTEKTINWQIDNIIITSYNDIDPEQYYILEPNGKFSVDFNKLYKNGSIIPINKNQDDLFATEFYGKNELGNEVVFKDLSVTKYIGEEQVTYFKRVQRDSIFAKVPVVKTQSVYKSFEDKAQEAANFIFMIREKRFELLSGSADFYPEGKSLDVALKEMDRLENEYLDLFIGKKFTSTYTANFEFTPNEKDLELPYILFRFDEKKGVLSPNDLTGRPIIVEMEKMNQTKNLSYLTSDQINREGNTYKNKLFYRIPDVAKIKVFDGKTLLATRKINIEQLGIVVSIPAKFLMEEDTFIKFYSE